VSVSVCWPGQSKNTESLSLFAELLETLPKVHTLEVLRIGSMNPGPLELCFKGKSLPSIQRIVLPTRAHEILKCCSKVREVTCNEGDGRQLIDALLYAGCNGLESLRGVMVEPALTKRK
jgi:hypothetical protein